MEQQTQAQIEAWIQFIDSTENPATVTNVIVAAVLKYLMDKAKEVENLNIDSRINQLSSALDSLVSGDTTNAIESFNEVIEFLAGVTDDETLSGLLLSLRNDIEGKTQKAGDGRLNPQEAPTVMLDSMGPVLDSVGSTSTVVHVVAQGDYIFSAGAIKYYRIHNGPGDTGNEVVILGPPQQGLVYCNKKTGLQYRWTGSDTGWVQVGGGRVINDLTTGGTIDSLSAEMGKELKSMIENIETTAVDAVPVIDGFNSNTVLCAASARSVKILKDNVDAIMNALANMAFTDGRPVLDWAGQITQFTISIGSLTSGITVLHGTDSVTTPLTLNEGEVTLKLSSNNMHLDTITLKDGSNNDVEFTRSIVDGYTVIKFILSSNVTLSATAVQGIAYTIQGTGISAVTGYAKPNTAEEITINLPQHYHWDGDLSATYGGTAITCNVTTDAAGNRVVTLPNNLSDTSKSIVITCSAAENAKITLSWSDEHMVVKKVNTPVTGSSVVVYDDEAPCSLTFEPADGYKWSSAPSASGLTFSGSGNYSARTLTINDVESTTSYNISADTAAKSTNYTVGMGATPENFTATVKDMSDNVIEPVEGTISILEGNGVKIVLTPDTDYLVAISSVTMGGETLASEDYTVESNGGIKTIIISQVTGDIVVTANATQVTKYNIYTPALSLMNIMLSSDGNDINDYKAIEGMPLRVVITPNTGQRITFYEIKMGSTDITNSAVENQDGSVTIDIASVNGAVDIDAVASTIGNHIVEHKLLNYTASDNDANTATDPDFGYPQHTVADSDGYQTTLSVVSGATSNNDVTVLMGGKDITATAYNSGTGVVSIDHVIGDVTIIATAATGTIVVETNDIASIKINNVQYDIISTDLVEGTSVYRKTINGISNITSIFYYNDSTETYTHDGSDKKKITAFDFGGATIASLFYHPGSSTYYPFFGGQIVAKAATELTKLTGLVINSTDGFGYNSGTGGAFDNCTALVELGTVGWKASSAAAYRAFASTKIQSLDIEGISSLNREAVFSGCTLLSKLRLNRKAFSTSNTFESWFANCGALKEVIVPKCTKTVSLKLFKSGGTSGDGTKIDLSSVFSVSSMFSAFKGSSGLKEIRIGAFDTSSMTSDYNHAFQIFQGVYNNSVCRLVCMSATPPKIGTINWLTQLPSNWSIVVPDGCGDTYKEATGWASVDTRIKEKTDWNNSNPNNQV